MSGNIVFAGGEFEREIAIRGLTLETFAAEADVNPATVSRAVRGLAVKPKSRVKMLTALARLPVIEGPVELVRSA